LPVRGRPRADPGPSRRAPAAVRVGGLGHARRGALDRVLRREPAPNARGTSAVRPRAGGAARGARAVTFLSSHHALLRAATAVAAALLPARGRLFLLLGASYVFYAAAQPAYLALIVGTTLVDYAAALGIAGSDRLARRHAYLIVAL